MTLEPELIVEFDSNALVEVAEPRIKTAPFVLETVFEPLPFSKK